MTLGRKIGLGFAATVAFAVIIAAVSIFALRGVTEAKDAVIDGHARKLVLTQRLNTAAEQRVAGSRGFALTGKERFTVTMADASREFTEAMRELREGDPSSESSAHLDAIQAAYDAHGDAVDRLVELVKGGAGKEQVTAFLEKETLPPRDALDRAIEQFVTARTGALDGARALASERAEAAGTTVLIIAILSVLIAGALAFVIVRGLTRQIGDAVQHVQSSSAELQTASHQQASGAQEQVSAMTEIATTVNELIATSHQIAGSAQRVSQIAGQTAGSAQGGEHTVSEAQESMAAIKGQVELIVNHMLDLGAKSQQIGAILEIINELAEQTNILSINASIEAAGAGEAGRRFGVVADEIRKLADRVGGSTKEIRALIEEIRRAVNTTVMVTEGGAKSVAAGSRHFDQVATSFRHIAELVTTTTEAAREIELSTKQQATAVEQVKVAISNVAQATREAEASSSQTHQTSVQLASLSRELVRMIQPAAGA